MDLIDLITQVRTGNVEAYRPIVQRFQGMACGYALGLLGDFHLAEDAAQEAFLEAYRNLDQLSDPAAFPGWFRQIVHHRCGRFMRSRKPPTVALDAARDVRTQDRTPEQLAQQHEMTALVRIAIDSLPEQQRAVTAMFYLGGESHQDIATFMGMPLGTVKHQLHLARRTLKQRMVHMVEKTFKQHAPTPDFERKVFAKMVQAGIPLSQGLGGFPVLHTDAVRLREIRPVEDAAACVGAVPYGDRTDWTADKLQQELQGVRDRFYNKQYVICWAVARKEDDQMIGNIRYWEWQGHPECPLAFGTIQFDIAPGHEMLAAQAVRLAAEFGLKTLGLVRVQWSTSADVDPRSRIVQDAGFVREGLLRAWWYDAAQESWQNEQMYSLVASDLVQRSSDGRARRLEA